MATLNLTKVWVNRLDTGEAVSAQSDRKRAREHSMAGDVRTYAGGRQRAISQEGERGTFDVTLVRVTPADIETLRAWQGIPVQVRDHRGQRFVGVFFAVPVVEQRDDVNAYDVPLSLRIVTVVEGV